MKKKVLNYKLSVRILSFILCLIIMFLAIPSVIFAEVANTIDNLANTDSSYSNDNDIYSYVGDAFEVETLREETIKHFHLEDGTYVAAQYNYPVHYIDETGVMQDIDNQLSESSGGVFANKNARVKFAKKITGNETLFSLHDGNTKLTLSLNNAVKGVKGVVTNNDDSEETTQLQKMMNLEKLSSSVIYRDILSGVDLEYVLVGNSIKENIIIKEKADSYSYEFELSLNGLSASPCEDGSISLTDRNGSIRYVIPAPIIFDAEGIPGSASYALSEQNGNGKYNLTVTADSEWLNSEERVFPVTLDPAICPAISATTAIHVNSTVPTNNYSNSNYLYVYSNGTAYWKTSNVSFIPKNSYISNASLSVRTESTSNGYIGVHLVTSAWDSTLTYEKTQSSSPEGAIDDEIISYTYVNGVKDTYFYFDITEAVKSWYGNSSTNYGVALKYIQGGRSYFYSMTSATAENRPCLTVSYVNHNGIESYNSYSSHSAGVAGTGSIDLSTGQLSLAIPTLSTTDSLMPYAPTLVYNSSMSNEHYTYSYTETANTYSYMPLGFKLNICETVIKKSFVDNTGTTKYYYVYADPDGTEHGFYVSGTDSSVYIDDNGMQKTLTVQSDGSVAITDDTKWTRIFTKKSSNPSSEVSGAWYLSKITDESGNAIIFTYDSSLRPTKVSMKPNGSTQIDFLDLYYYSTGKLRMIYNSTSKDAVVFRYSSTYSGAISTTSNNYLRQIDYAHGNTSTTLSNWESFATSASNLTNITVDATAKYDYNSSGYITYAIDNVAGQKFYYLWLSKKVIALRQFAGTALGQCISYTYGTGYTDVKSTGNDDVIDTADDIITRYVFDDKGRSKSLYSYSKNGTEIYDAIVVEYETQENIKNNIKEQTIIGGGRVNYLLNGDFEETSSTSSFDHWVISGAVSRTIEYFDGEGEYCATFDPVSGATASLTQYVSLKAGDYTFSMPYITQICDNVIGAVVITSTAGSGFSHSEEIPLNQNYSNGTETAFSTSFTVPNYTNGGDKLKITIKFTAGANVTSAPSIDIDRVVLENNLGASRFSLVSYGSFDASGLNASGTATPLSSYWKTESNASPTVVSGETLFGNSAKVTGQINSKKYVKQRIYQIPDSQLNIYDYGSYNDYSNAGYEYIVSGFGFAEHAVYSPNASFRIRVDVIYYQGMDNSDVTVSHYFDFIPCCTGWQFTGGSFDTEYTKDSTDNNDYSCVRAIDVYCEYSYQPEGYALFDNISVVNSNGTDVEKYYYYSEGTENGLLARKENIFYSEYYEYDDNRNLSRVANNRGEITDYFYTSTNKIDYTIDYDFVWISDGHYPYAYEDPDAEITKTPKTKTDYTYDTYGLTTTIETYQLDANLNKLSGSKKLYNQYLYNTTSGSKIFGSLRWEQDGLDVDVKYYYDESNGRLLATVNSDENTGICYTYDEMDNLVGVRPASYVSSTSYSPITNAENITYTYNSNNLLSSITTESTTYSFTYDVFGNPTSIKAGDNTVSSYSYNKRNGKLNKVTYSNGFIVEYVYNDIELLTEIWYTDDAGTKQKAYEYEYTADGQVHEFIDNINGRSTVYKYDNNNRLVAFIEYENDDFYHDFSSKIYYDDKGLLSSVYYNINHLNGSAVDASSWSYSYLYDDSSELIDEVIIRTATTAGGEYYYYDDYYRVYQRVNTNHVSGNSSADFRNQIDYTYAEYNDRTSNWVKTYTSTVNDGTALTYTFTYDQNGNITKIVFSTGEEIRYVYDDLGQLLREDNGLIGSTYVYTYDNAGNILTRKYYSLTAEGTTPTNLYLTYTYSYSTSGWGDLLTSYNGREITYDEIGNPINYYNGFSYTFSWTGKELTGIVNYGDTYSFTYNDAGIRTTKTKNGVTTTYYLSGSQILAEETSGNVTVYIYDSEGLPLGMQYHKASYAEDVWDVYLYEKNIFGDIVAIYDEAGTKLISYKYDAYGCCVSKEHNGGYSTTAYNNPFRYRGYYYDRDLELYYLNARYYDGYTGRFISPDDVLYLGANGDLLSYNLYAYCSNNPVMYVDPTGKWTFSFGINFSAFLGFGVGYSLNLSFDSKGNIALQTSVADVFNSGATFGVGSIGISQPNTVTNYDTVFDLEGAGLSAGLSFPVYGPFSAGADAIISMDNDSLRGVSVAGGVGTGIDVHTVVGETKTTAKTTFKDVAKTILKVAKWFRKR